MQAQKKSREQLFKDLSSTVDTIRLKANYQLAKNYLRVSLDTSENFAAKAIELAQKLNDKKIESEANSLKRNYTLHFISILSALVDRL